MLRLSVADCPLLAWLSASLYISLFVCQGMFSTPPNCERASCMAYVQWTPIGSATIWFELEATAAGWVAVGVSADQVMGGNGIDDVFACQRDAVSDIVYAEDTYNPQNQAPRTNIRDSVSIMSMHAWKPMLKGLYIFPFTFHSYSQDQTGFQLINSSFSSGRISCSFIRSVFANNPAEDRNLNEAAFILLAYGFTRGMYVYTHGPYTNYFLFTSIYCYVTP